MIYLSPHKKCSFSGKATAQSLQVLPKRSMLSPPDDIRKHAHEAWLLENSVTEVWACQLLWCFCSLMGDAICKVNCSWWGRLHGCMTRTRVQGPMLRKALCFIQCSTVLKFLIISEQKTPYFYFAFFFYNLCCRSWVATYTSSSTM